VTGPTCRRCGAELGTSYHTEVVAAAQHRHEIGPDGSGFATVLAATSACSWNCLAVLAAELAGPDADAAVQVVAERERQISSEGWTPEHDEHHPEGDLARAGALYAVHATDSDGKADGAPPAGWPWDAGWWKPKDRLRDLVRAGALVAAEADREVRAKRQQRERF
jgi:hypothetical protein